MLLKLYGLLSLGVSFEPARDEDADDELDGEDDEEAPDVVKLLVPLSSLFDKEDADDRENKPTGLTEIAVVKGDDCSLLVLLLLLNCDRLF